MLGNQYEIDYSMIFKSSKVTCGTRDLIME